MPSLVELEISMYLSLAQVTVNKYEISYGEVHLLIMLTKKARRDGGFSSWVIHRVDGNPGLSLRRNMGKKRMSGKRQRGERELRSWVSGKCLKWKSVIK